MKKVTVVIPNYNGLRFMEPCFGALKRQLCRDFEVLVVDNGSTDGSAAWLRERRIPTVFLEQNTGFSGAVNVGIRQAVTPYVILLNNDTEPEPDYMGEMIRAIERSPRIFSVSPKIMQLYDKELMDDAGDMYSVLGWAFQRGVGRPERKYNKARRVFSACAAAGIYRRRVFEEIGYFDELHFAYLEDIDVGYRARIAGYDNVYWPGARVYHVGSGTSGGKYNAFKVRLAARNNVFLNYKNMPGWQLALNGAPIAAGIWVKYGFFKRMGFGREYWEGFLEGVRERKKCRRVSVKKENFGNYMKIQGELAAGTLVYVWEFGCRQLGKIINRNIKKLR